MFKNEIKLRLI